MGLESVADAGPPIHLTEIGSLSALRVFSRVHVPEAVWNEITGQEHIDTSLLKVLDNLQQHSPDQSEIDEFVRAHKLDSLHKGEQASLYLCRALQIPLLLTDDLAARDAAQVLGITPVGSLGIVVRAFREGLFSMDTAEQYLLDLQTVSSLFVTRAIVELAVEQLRNAPPQA